MIARLGAVVVAAALLAPVDACDRRLESDLQRLRRPGLEHPMHALSEGCNRTTVIGGLLALALIGGPAGLETARLAVVTLVPTNLMVEALKRLTDRPRPDGEHRRSNSSFPSSHVANAFALALILSRRWRRAAPLFVLLAVAVAAARLYLNRHFPSDAVCGALIGVGMAWGCGWAWDRRAVKRAAGSGLEPEPSRW